MPGYMPDSDPDEFDDADDAREYLADRMDEDAEALDDGIDPECLSDDTSHIPGRIKELRDAAEELRLSDAKEFGTIVAGTSYWLTRDGYFCRDDEADDDREALAEWPDEESARDAIDSDPLSVDVRSGWSNAGETLTAEEFRIVLCTGGPHVELQGDIGEWSRVRVIHKDWGTSGEYYPEESERAALAVYCENLLGWME